MSHDSPELLKRREVLRRVALLLGGAVSAPAALAILQGCAAKESAPGVAWKPRFLSEAQAPVLSEIAEIFIPKTDTSGAIDAGVPAFIDTMLADVYSADAQARFRAGLVEFETTARAGGKAFLSQDAPQRVALVRQSLDAALAADADDRPFILMARELAILGFYTSKVGITENMDYVPVPTAYHGCVPLSQMKKPVYWE